MSKFLLTDRALRDVLIIFINDKRIFRKKKNFEIIILLRCPSKSTIFIGVPLKARVMELYITTIQYRPWLSGVISIYVGSREKNGRFRILGDIWTYWKYVLAVIALFHCYSGPGSRPIEFNAVLGIYIYVRNLSAFCATATCCVCVLNINWL